MRESRTAAGYVGSSGKYALPDLRTPSSVAIRIADRSRHTPTIGPSMAESRSAASLPARSGSASYPSRTVRTSSRSAATADLRWRESRASRAERSGGPPAPVAGSTTGSTSGPRVSRAPAAPRSVARPASGSMTTSRSPAATSCPFAARISATTPAIGAQKVISTFIASRNPSTCPAATRSPGVTCTPTTIAGVAARTCPVVSQPKP